MWLHVKDDSLLRLLPVTSIPTYYDESVDPTLASNAFATSCPIAYSYSLISPHALSDGTRLSKSKSDNYDGFRVQRSESEVQRFSFEKLRSAKAMRHGKVQLRQVDTIRRGRGSPSPTRRIPGSGPRAGVGGATEAGTPGQRFFGRWRTKKLPTQYESRDRPPGGAVATSPSSSQRIFGPTASEEEESKLLEGRLKHFLATHLKQDCRGLSNEQCMDCASEYRNAQFLQTTETYRLMLGVWTSPATQVRLNSLTSYSCLLYYCDVHAVDAMHEKMNIAY